MCSSDLFVIAGGGNILGEEQSGHIKDVGYELYHEMLEEALSNAKGKTKDEYKPKWSPTLNLGIPILIPAKYINDLDVRISMYKRFKSISEIILFDSKGYEKSIGFDHRLLNSVSTSVNKMIAGNIQYDDKLDKYSKITDIIDISGSLETSGKKDISKIKIFLENIDKIKNEN